MKTFTDEQVTAAIEKVVAGREDYVYSSGRDDLRGCFYATGDGGPSCLVGFVIKELDADLFEKVVEIERTRSTSPEVGVLVGLLDGELNISGEAELALRAAQAHQDFGRPWGAALEEYQNVMADSSEDDE